MAAMTFGSILVVCTGNVCRSPIGERLLRQALPQMRVASAGLAALVGQPADALARRVAELNGVSLEGHVARRLTAQVLQEYELILVMELAHLDHISRIAPACRGKALLFGQWLARREIPDPYRKSVDAFEHVFALLGSASQEWAQRLSR
ncbi:arsenate reductase/protein-tyrosine-phosphatase family protein [Pseudenterobacter timonensis]|uniref:arsenate reductase/protein-tyrosine-phosphatase family protein n=1 Tax=Pseudenterobacter timonensis TaxID=1755099 RepID=UPI00077B7D9E|nr:protein tyrosine phosphatase [Pseudenterobacter timonensis]